MRNLKRVLSLALAALMLMGMMVVGAGAASKDFTDASEIKNVEAVDVMVALGVLEGGDKGDFQPNSILTREQAAKIICYLLLGEENAEKLTTNYSIFSDVPANRWSAPYISYCVNLGILAGDGAGHFFPEGKLTGVAFAKMLLVCLGYSAERENYVGNNWEINTSAAAIAAGIAPKELDLSKELSRDNAALMAFNTLEGTMVEYLNDNTIIIGGETIISTTGKASAVKQYPYEDTMDAENLQFAEKYFGKLKKLDDVDDFDRPAHTWSYKGEEVGTFVNWDEMVGEFTTSVTGKDLYDLLTATTIKKYDFAYYVDGKLVDNVIKASNMIRTNTYAYETTGNGALTQVFVDSDNSEIVVTTINTYLAKAAADYNEKRGELTLNIYRDKTIEQVVEVEDFPAIATVKEGEAFLVNVAETTKDKYEVVIMSAPEIISDAKLTKYSTRNYLVTDGTQYDYAKKGSLHNAKELDLYNQSALDNTYDVYLDQYGYVIGTEKVSGELKYLFMTGYDRPTTHLGVKTAEAAAIFMDGTMQKIEVNVTKSNPQIAGVNGYSELRANGGDWMSRYNRWFSYTVDKNGVYTLTPVDNWVNTDYDAKRDVINSASVRLDGTGYNKLGQKGTDDGRDVAYGNDDSVYITVGLGRNDYNSSIIDEVNNIYTGVQNVDMKITKDTTTNPITESVFTVYDEDRYVIASIVIGDDVNNNKNFAYGIDKDAMSEYVKDDDGYYYWDFEAVVDGEIKTLTVKAEYIEAIKNISNSIVTGEGSMLELTYDKDGYVVDALVLKDQMQYNNKTEDFIYGNHEYTDKQFYTDDFGIYLVNVGVNSSDIPNTTTLSTNGKTLWLTGKDYGLTIAEGASIIVVQEVWNKDDTKYLETEVETYTNFNAALKALAQESVFKGQISAVLNDKGTAEYVVLNSAIHDGVEVDNGNNTNGAYYMTTGVGAKTNTASTEVLFNLYKQADKTKVQSGTVDYEYKVEILNGGSWVESLTGSGKTTFADGNFAFEVPVNGTTNSSDVRVTVTVTDDTYGTVLGYLVINAK